MSTVNIKSFFPLRSNFRLTFLSECVCVFEGKIDQADIADWMSFLPSTLMEEEISPNPDAVPLRQILNAFHLEGIAEKTNI